MSGPPESNLQLEIANCQLSIQTRGYNQFAGPEQGQSPPACLIRIILSKLFTRRFGFGSLGAGAIEGRLSPRPASLGFVLERDVFLRQLDDGVLAFVDLPIEPIAIAAALATADSGGAP